MSKCNCHNMQDSWYDKINCYYGTIPVDWVHLNGALSTLTAQKGTLLLRHPMLSFTIAEDVFFLTVHTSRMDRSTCHNRQITAAGWNVKEFLHFILVEPTLRLFPVEVPHKYEKSFQFHVYCTFLNARQMGFALLPNLHNPFSYFAKFVVEVFNLFTDCVKASCNISIRR